MSIDDVFSEDGQTIAMKMSERGSAKCKARQMEMMQAIHFAWCNKRATSARLFWPLAL
ncbi:MAG: hypothetical protein Q4A28_03045 [Brachymonas sp.]|nr:hypothetical protein [Brachymonas sp.]